LNQREGERGNSHKAGSKIYTRIQCVGGIWGSGPQAVQHLPQSPFTGQFYVLRSSNRFLNEAQTQASELLPLGLHMVR
jgi:hypothetical protein